MGLDLYHLKATLHPEDPGEATTFREDDFDDFALDVLGFRRFIQVIPDTDYPTRIVIVKDEETLGSLRETGRKWITGGKDVVLLFGEPSPDLVRRVEEVEAANGWDPAERRTELSIHWGLKDVYFHHDAEAGGPKPLAEWTRDLTDAVGRYPSGPDPPAWSLRISHPVAADYRGLYAEEVGYQRKGMSSEFYEEFRATSHHVLRSDVVRAARHLDATGDPDEDRLRRDHFHDQFLARFEEGTSIFEVSY